MNGNHSNLQPSLSARESTPRLALILALLALIAGSASAFGQDGPPADQALALHTDEIAAVLEYWTLERMRNAIPRPLSGIGETFDGKADGLPTGRLSKPGRPAIAAGWFPGSGLPQPSADTLIELRPEDPTHALATAGAHEKTTPPFSPPANPTDFVNHAPMQRWTWYGRYLTYPTSTIGKLFFTLNGLDFVCSGAVIQRRTIATAGHCTSDGAGNFASSAMFCPSYNRGGGTGAPNAATGCWVATWVGTSFQWHNSGNLDRDYGCYAFANTNATTGNFLGNVTGWLGRAINFTSRQAEHAWGYPQGAPFPGYHIIAATSTEWYEVNTAPGDSGAAVDQVSKYIGSDMTGGSSGGPWWLNTAHQNNAFEYADTDGSLITDPFQTHCCPVLNGVNSHRRCTQGGCPAGSVFTQEMGSPQMFGGNAADLNESEDVWPVCFNNNGT